MKRSVLNLKDEPPPSREPSPSRSNDSDDGDDGRRARMVAIIISSVAALFLVKGTGIPLTALLAIPLFWLLKRR